METGANAPSLDRRLDRLTERHEALTQSIELMRLDAQQQHQEWLQRSQQIDERIGKLAQAQTDLTVTMKRLANIDVRHEERLDAIDGAE